MTGGGAERGSWLDSYCNLILLSIRLGRANIYSPASWVVLEQKTEKYITEKYGIVEALFLDV